MISKIEKEIERLEGRIKYIEGLAFASTDDIRRAAGYMEAQYFLRSLLQEPKDGS